MAFNENTRVKIPAILHLCRLGYQYLSFAKAERDASANLFSGIFEESMLRLNPGMSPEEARRLREDVVLSLDNEDLGQAFYQLLTSTSGPRLLDFSNFSNNALHVVTELPCKNGEDEFRPDITLLINGMPLAFIEVKKPNNHEGILQERDRIQRRFSNPKFRRFINISQILVFSNNMEYDHESIEPVQGAFYATTSSGAAMFNCFREEEHLSHLLREPEEEVENFVLKDNNLISIKHSPEFLTNKEPHTPTNRILTSLFSPDRLAFLLKYGLAYVKEERGLEKHIMRYPQIFATRAIERKLEAGIRKGIIWHTQGSGKTALAYFNVQYLTDYFQKKEVVAKFYFIVDRLDLMNQAKREFTSRGLVVHTVSSREELMRSFQMRRAVHNKKGDPEITVVNIQKFNGDEQPFREKDYDLSTQRVYFLDEVHRSYDPKGSFLANLVNSDRNAILIGLTGTPLISEDRTSRATFGDYLHKYYYNASIADGYTLKLIREDIETSYKIQLREALQEITVLQQDIDRRKLYAHPQFVEPMLDYIVKDFTESRVRFGDHGIGGMVVCDSAAQAEMMFRIFCQKYNPEQTPIARVEPLLSMAAEATPDFNAFLRRHPRKIVGSLILHDFGSNDDRKKEVELFKEGKIDLLFVYNMLLTGFDARRLKKLYLGRVIKDHNLLQTLTRVNRPYKQFRYGYVVDFADITKEFELTNKAYFDELQAELGDEMQHYSNLFKSKEEIEEEIRDIREKLFHYDLQNSEVFDRQLNEIDDRQQVLALKKALESAKNLYNLIRLEGHFDLLSLVDFQKLNILHNLVAGRLDTLNLKATLENSTDTTNLLNIALENIVFSFRKVAEEEMVIADQLKNTLQKTREAMNGNFDQQDPQFISLYEALKKLFHKKNLDEITQEDMKHNIGALELIYDKVTELNRKNNLLKAKYEQDAKYARMHKRILERGGISRRESDICDALTDIKAQVDDQVLINTNMLSNESYFQGLLMKKVIDGFGQRRIQLDADSARFINACLAKEYMHEFHGTRSW